MQTNMVAHRSECPSFDTWRSAEFCAWADSFFTLYMIPLGNIIKQQSIHFHCYDSFWLSYTKVWNKMKPVCWSDNKHVFKTKRPGWLNFLLLNSNKTKFVVFGPECFRKTLPSFVVTLDRHYIGFHYYSEELCFPNQFYCLAVIILGLDHYVSHNRSMNLSLLLQTESSLTVVYLH